MSADLRLNRNQRPWSFDVSAITEFLGDKQSNSVIVAKSTRDREFAEHFEAELDKQGF